MVGGVDSLGLRSSGGKGRELRLRAGRFGVSDWGHLGLAGVRV